MSIMFPTIFALGIYGLGDQTKKASAYIVMAIMGGMIVPKLMGKVADLYDMSHSFVVPLACFVIIAIYAYSWPKLAKADSLHGVKAGRGHCPTVSPARSGPASTPSGISDRAARRPWDCPSSASRVPMDLLSGEDRQVAEQHHLAQRHRVFEFEPAARGVIARMAANQSRYGLPFGTRGIVGGGSADSIAARFAFETMRGLKQ